MQLKKYISQLIALVLIGIGWTSSAPNLSGQGNVIYSLDASSLDELEGISDVRSDAQSFSFDRKVPRVASAIRPTHELSLFAGIDGSKQPQDYGVNANLGGRLHVNFSGPLYSSSSIGFQVGAAFHESMNAVRVYELIGEDTSRNQLFTTVGFFRRTEIFGAGIVVDLLNQNSYDQATLGQIRSRVSFWLNARNEVGLTTRFRLFDDETNFLGNSIALTPIDQGSVFFRHLFNSGVQGTVWIGIADAIGESNAVTGFSPSKDESLVFGADFLAPLNEQFAMYGETNLTFPADTGTVDAFLGIAWYPFGNARCARRHEYSAMLPVAAPTSFGVNLIP